MEIRRRAHISIMRRTTPRYKSSLRHHPQYVVLSLLGGLILLWTMMIVKVHFLSPTTSNAVPKQKFGLRRHSFRGSTSSLPPMSLFPVLNESVVATLNDQYLQKQLNVDHVLLWAHRQFSPQLIQFTSFGPSGMVLLHKMHALGILRDVPIVTIDTLHLFEETYSFVRTVKEYYHHDDELSVHTYHPKGYSQRDDFDEVYGKDLWKTNPDNYDYLTKVEPTLRALSEQNPTAYMTGRRRSQGGERTNLQVFELDVNMASGPRLKINPLAYWSYKDVWDYIRKHNVPYNPLVDLGYKSIGDDINTVPVTVEAEERSGRFVGLGVNKTECGMHAHLAKIKQMKQQAEQDGQDFVMPTLPCLDCLDIDTNTFDDVVLNNSGGGGSSILLEFYSPMCGTCQEMAPIYKEIAAKLKSFGNTIQAARFDITEHDIPKSAKQAGMKVTVTPTLYLIQHQPTFQLTKYDGMHDVQSILMWLEEKTNIKVSSRLLI